MRRRTQQQKARNNAIALAIAVALLGYVLYAVYSQFDQNLRYSTSHSRLSMIGQDWRHKGSREPGALVIWAERAVLDVVDGWGRTLRVTRQEEEVEIRSAGRNGRFEDDDDLFITLMHTVPRYRIHHGQ